MNTESKKKSQKLPKWFDGELYSEGGTVKNPFSGEEYELTAPELSMYRWSTFYRNDVWRRHV
jgi:hypothetical protein